MNIHSRINYNNISGLLTKLAPLNKCPSGKVLREQGQRDTREKNKNPLKGGAASFWYGAAGKTISFYR